MADTKWPGGPRLAVFETWDYSERLPGLENRETRGTPIRVGIFPDSTDYAAVCAPFSASSTVLISTIP